MTISSYHDHDDGATLTSATLTSVAQSPLDVIPANTLAVGDRVVMTVAFQFNNTTDAPIKEPVLAHALEWDAQQMMSMASVKPLDPVSGGIIGPLARRGWIEYDSRIASIASNVATVVTTCQFVVSWPAGLDNSEVNQAWVRTNTINVAQDISPVAKMNMSPTDPLINVDVTSVDIGLIPANLSDEIATRGEIWVYDSGSASYVPWEGGKILIQKAGEPAPSTVTNDIVWKPMPTS